jgi:protein-disulfide isomerase
MSDYEPRLIVPVSDEDHAQGPVTAPITLVEYGDYECPYCGQAFRIIQAVQRHLGARLRFVFRNMPLNQIHPHAELAAEAAEAAGAQNRFWAMHDELYENQANLSVELIGQLAQKLKLDIQRFAGDLRQGRFRARVRNDFKGGVRSGVAGTPSFYINGERFDGDWTDPSAFLAALTAIQQMTPIGPE